MLDVILDTILDTLKAMPFLYLAYLLMEALEHKMNHGAEKTFKQVGFFAPAVGGLLGLVPQCGFSAAASSLYSGGAITLGTLFAVFLSTSDEMVLIMISHALDGTFQLWSVIRVLLGKLIIGLLFGFLIDFIMKLIKKKKQEQKETEEQDVEVEECYHHGHERGVWISALFHMLQIAAFLFVTSLALNITMYYVGEEVLANAIEKAGVFKYLASSLIGIIPNCASSVVITELYVKQAISLGTLFAGVLPGAGIGLLVLLKSNKNWKSNLAIISSLVVIGIGCGILIDVLNLTFFGLIF